MNTHEINQHKFQQNSCQFDNTIQCNFHRELDTVNWHIMICDFFYDQSSCCCSRTQLNNFSYFVSYLGSNFHSILCTLIQLTYLYRVWLCSVTILLWNSTFCFFSCFCCFWAFVTACWDVNSTRLPGAGAEMAGHAHARKKAWDCDTFCEFPASSETISYLFWLQIQSFKPQIILNFLSSHKKICKADH